MRSIFICVLFCNVLCAQTWVQLKDFPGSRRDDGVAVAIGNTVFCGSGLETGWHPTRDFYGFDVQAGNWYTVTPMPDQAQRQYACAFEVPGGFMVFGGDAGGPLNSLLRYDIAADKWSTMSPKPGAGLMGAVSMRFGDKVIIAAGRTPDGVSGEVWEYSIWHNAWTRKKDLPFRGVWRASASVSGANGYLMCGRRNDDSFNRDLFRYDPASDSWSHITAFTGTTPRAYAALEPIGAGLVLFGGHDTLYNFFSDSWIFDLQQNQWSKGPDFPSTARKGGMCAAIAGKLFYSCGIGKNDERLRETWLLDLPLSAEEEKNEGTMIFPQPFSASLFISTREDRSAFSITDLYGNALVKDYLRSGVNELSTAQLPPGLYLLRISAAGKKEIIKKLLKN